jgi:hypothetical protein
MTLSGAIQGATLNGTTSVTSPTGNITTVNSTTVNTTNANVPGTLTVGTLNATTTSFTNINASGTITAPVIDGTTSMTTPTGNITTVNSSTVGTGVIYIGAGSTPISFYDEWSATVSFTGPWASPNNTFMRIQRINDALYYYIRGLGTIAAVAAQPMTLADGTIPAAFRPSILREVGTFTTINNSVYQVSSVAVRSAGGILISGGLQNTLPFTASGNAGTMDIEFVLSTN